MNESNPPKGDCPVCAGAVDERERVFCPRCETPHHRDCYGYNQGCAIFGCNPEQLATPLPKKATPGGLPLPLPELARNSRAAQAGLFVLAVLGTFTVISAWHIRERAATGPVARIRAQHRHSEQPATGYRAPDFELKDLDGQPHRLRAITAGKISVLTFWLAGCPDCLDSFPKGVALSKALARDPVAFVDVAYRGQPEPTAEWVRENGIKNPVLLDTGGSIVSKYGVGTYTCFVLDQKGFIRYRGSVSGAEEAVRALLEPRDRTVRTSNATVLIREELSERPEAVRPVSLEGRPRP